jgi:hypothetical protein
MPTRLLRVRLGLFRFICRTVAHYHCSQRINISPLIRPNSFGLQDGQIQISRRKATEKLSTPLGKNSIPPSSLVAKCTTHLVDRHGNLVLCSTIVFSWKMATK